jgi:hypothetical protein
MKLPKKKRLPSVLGLNLTDGQLRACHMVRAKGGHEVVKSASAALSINLLHPESELVGREIKNHLDAAGIRERHCVVAVPATWIMSQQSQVPDLGAEDTASFLQIEAEKGFPIDPAQLQIARSSLRTTAGSHVTQLGVRREQLDKLSSALKAAGLKPVGFTLGLTVLPGAIAPAGGGGRVIVAVETTGVTLLASAGGGIAAFRTFEASIESEAGEKIINGAAVARELRITIEQVPADLRSELKQLFLTGEPTMVRQLAESIAGWAKNAGLTITRDDSPEENFAAEIAEKLALRWLEAGSVEPDFLPPRPSQFARLMARYNSKRLATVGFAVGAVALIALLAFAWQEYRRWSLRSEWNAMAAQVLALDAVQARIDEFKPWYDTTHRSLTIMMRVTECFPDNGSVTAKTFEVHGNATTVVTISGTARDNASLLHVQELLRKAKEVQGLKIEQIRGKTPMQFTLTFRWKSNSGT